LIGRAVDLLRASSGARASSYLLAGTVASLLGTYAYNLVCIRWLGLKGYGDVAALTALATILLLPLLGVQAAVSRETARFRAAGDVHSEGALLHMTTRRVLVLDAIAIALLVALSPAISSALKIGATASAVAAAFLVGSGVIVPVFQGFLQGAERFGRAALALGVYGVSRPLFAMPLMLLGFGVAGAITGSTVAALVAGAITVAGLGDVYRRHERGKVALELEGFKPVIVGLLAFTILVNADVVVAKAFLDPEEAGTYAAASLVGKLAALLPAGAIAPVLLPRATGRLHRGEDPTRLVSISLAATAAFGVAFTAVLLAVPRSFVEWGFGEEFGDAEDLLAPCAAVMALCGIINVNLTFAFALRDNGLVVLVCAAVAVQAVLFALLHDSAYEILAATALAALFVIVLHELRSPAAMWRLLRPG
jgi:O-antigen/teichoic acid export membrane protein